MDKEKRHLIKEKADALVDEYEAKAKEAKAHGNAELALVCYNSAAAVSRFMLEILMLDAQGKI